MNTTKTLILAAAAFTLALPAAAWAQPYYGQPRASQPYYGPHHGDAYGRRRATFRGYPEFRQVEAHIRGEINQGVADDLLAPEDAADFRQQLRDIQLRELRTYRAYGWNLPENDRAMLRNQLDQLDRLVDQTRDEA